MRPRRIPFWDISCQTVSPIEIGATQSMARATTGLLRDRRLEREDAEEDRRDEVEERDAEQPDEPLDRAVDPPVERADLLARHPTEVDHHQMPDQPHAEVLIHLAQTLSTR